jgi:alpha-glucosidase
MTKPVWWQTAVFYQIYPRSFADSNGDGIGDLGGMIAKLDYLQDLGVDAIWLSPHFPSPQVDWGYDVADYYGVAPEYGTPEQLKTYLDELHKRGMRLILDLVLNHTSDQHPWFLESRSSRDNPKRDWYVWRKGKGEQPPNNWYSTFGGKAWEPDPLTGEWYYHFFFKEQPDLNWRNPEVRQAMWDMVRYYLDMGIDGFRLDAIGTIYEHPAMNSYRSPLDLQDIYRLERLAKESEEQMVINRRKETIFHRQHDQPGIHELMRELRQIVDEYDDRVLVGETDDLSFYGNGQDELHLIFNFPLMRTDRITPAWVRQNQAKRLAGLPEGSWPCNTLGNHDSPRLLSHFSDGAHPRELARLNLMLLLTLWGTPFLYNGEEIGMSDLLLAELEQFRDPLSLYAYRMERLVMQAGHAEAVAHAALRGRDRCRTPLQWSGAENAGFSPAGVRPWLPVNPDYHQGVNVADQMADPGSLWNDYRRLLHMRKRLPALQTGRYAPLDGANPRVLAFMREADGQRLLALLNYSDQAQIVSMPAQSGTLRPVFSTHPNRPVGVGLGREPVELGPFEGLVAEIMAG